MTIWEIIASVLLGGFGTVNMIRDAPVAGPETIGGVSSQWLKDTTSVAALASTPWVVAQIFWPHIATHPWLATAIGAAIYTVMFGFCAYRFGIDGKDGAESTCRFLTWVSLLVLLAAGIGAMVRAGWFHWVTTARLWFRWVPPAWQWSVTSVASHPWIAGMIALAAVVLVWAFWTWWQRGYLW